MASYRGFLVRIHQLNLNFYSYNMLYGRKVQMMEKVLSKPKNIINDWIGCTILDLPFIMETTIGT